eukprot:m.402506 g.402506  ORF g.402506 m.402506 type:complete len:427 (-) comp21180_c0_seq2:247-1527(-)
MPRWILATVGQNVNIIFSPMPQKEENASLFNESVAFREIKHCCCQSDDEATEHRCCRVSVAMSWCTTFILARCSGGSCGTELLGWIPQDFVDPTSKSGKRILEVSSSSSSMSCNWNTWCFAHGSEVLRVSNTHLGVRDTLHISTHVITKGGMQSKEHICDLQSSCSTTVVATAAGAVHVFSDARDASEHNTWSQEPLQFPYSGVRISKVACGKTHTMLLQDDQMAIYSLGTDGHGQLGHGECSIGQVLTPRRIDALHGIRIHAIAAGGWHSLVASVDGDVYTFGRDDCGQLGRATADIPASLPGCVDNFAEEHHFVAVAGGVSHSSALTRDGRVYAWGGNEFGQLGFFAPEDSDQCMQRADHRGDHDGRKDDPGRNEDIEGSTARRSPVELLAGTQLQPQAIFSNHSSNATCIVAVAHDDPCKDIR